MLTSVPAVAPEALALEAPVGIVGLGLLGGSLARAIRRHWPGAALLAIEPRGQSRRVAVAEGIVDEIAARPSSAFAAARTVLLCVPYAMVEPVSRALVACLRPGTLVCDVVAIKAPVAAIVEQVLPRLRYVGCHPMAGGARHGLENSRSSLFVGRPVAICTGATAAPGDVPAVSRFWRALGAHPILASPVEHDEIVARTSHLPYLLGLCLLRAAAEVPNADRLYGQAFADATRRAMFEPQVMAAAVAANRFVPASLRGLADECRRLADLIEQAPSSLLTEAERGRSLLAELAQALPPRAR